MVGRARCVERDISPAALKGKKIGVQRTTIHDRYLTAFYKGSEIVRYAKQDEVFLDLAAGRIDAARCATQVAGTDLGFLKKPAGKGFAFIGNPVIDDTELLRHRLGHCRCARPMSALQAEVQCCHPVATRANGVYKKIQDKYFDFDVYGK